ncbi:DUF2268 domain-containing putative Zn-dependent protease [uncultured Pedobacter sp.]|uniref:DUF2268 domain-containing putative Zn-dependent protease n=1 Tax=uncultured Pedobacter sp. TaxID=246139 RepID=UPI0025E19CD2|nr:DUF2268 domain-containing putative Zn-dependent protease [uncultured Pedobacter sp.]
MKPSSLLFLLSLFLFRANAQNLQQRIITSDIKNFWTAYDKIKETNDSTLHIGYLNDLFIDKGTDGLKSIMQAREYTAKSYLDAIYHYPLFWHSIRANTLRADEFADSIATEVDKLARIYSKLKPAHIYFTVGALRTNGTTLDGNVLIGSELALADENTVSSEFPKALSHLKTFFKSNPINGTVFLNVHEYVHTQQKSSIGYNLLSQCVIEGVAEFVAVTVTGKPSPSPAIHFGEQHFENIRSVFTRQMFFEDTGFWLYSNAENEFKMRDLGYYVGYEICKQYYKNTKDKKRAIDEMINLDYNNPSALYRFVDHSRYFNKPVSKFYREYDNSRPTVVGIKEFKNGNKKVNPDLTQITIKFSSKMDKRYRNFEFGPLGETHVLKIKEFTGFSEDGYSASFNVELKPNTRYQLLVGSGFRNENGMPLKPYLIEFTTAD